MDNNWEALLLYGEGCSFFWKFNGGMFKYRFRGLAITVDENSLYKYVLYSCQMKLFFNV